MTNRLQLLLALLITVFTFSANQTLAQDIAIDIEGKNFKTFQAMEKKLKSVLFQSEGDVIIPGGMAIPVTYRRIQQGIPDLLVTYTFSEKDSTIKSIEYEWDMLNFEKERKAQSLTLQKAMIKKYMTLLDLCTKKLGAGSQEGDLSDLSKIDQPHGLNRSDRWNPNDTTDVYLYSVFSNTKRKQGDATYEPTNRIRLLINRIPKSTAPKLDPQDIKAAQKTFDQFIVAARAGEIESARKELSETIRSYLTEAFFGELKGMIRPEAFRIWSKGMTASNNGSSYLMIEFAHINTPNPPNEILRVLFDKDHLIIGIQPLVRKEKSN